MKIIRRATGEVVKTIENISSSISEMADIAKKKVDISTKNIIIAVKKNFSGISNINVSAINPIYIKFIPGRKTDFYLDDNILTNDEI